MTENSTQIKLGDLLTRAQLLTSEQLREAMLISKQQALPVGRVLIMSQFIEERCLQASVQMQSMLKDGLLNLETAIAALIATNTEKLDLDSALEHVGWKGSNSQANKLGELLIEANCLTEKQLQTGLSQCAMSGLPLGRVLVSLSLVSEELIASALNAQILIRDGKISREQAIRGLKACKERALSIEQSLEETGVEIGNGESIRLGELLQLAHLAKEEEIMTAVERGLVEEKHIGQVLVEAGLVHQDALKKALNVQELVNRGELTKENGSEILAISVLEGLSIEESISRTKLSNKVKSTEELPFYQFLQLAGLINTDNIQAALKAGSLDAELMSRMLLLAGCLEENKLNDARRLHKLVTVGALKIDQSLMAVGICLNRNCSLEQAFKSLGWYLPNISGELSKESVDELKRKTGQFQALDKKQVKESPLRTLIQRPSTSEETDTVEIDSVDIDPRSSQKSTTDTAEAITPVSNSKRRESSQRIGNEEQETVSDGLDENDDKPKRRLADLIP